MTSMDDDRYLPVKDRVTAKLESAVNLATENNQFYQEFELEEARELLPKTIPLTYTERHSDTEKVASFPFVVSQLQMNNGGHLVLIADVWDDSRKSEITIAMGNSPLESGPQQLTTLNLWCEPRVLEHTSNSRIYLAQELDKKFEGTDISALFTYGLHEKLKEKGIEVEEKGLKVSLNGNRLAISYSEKGKQEPITSAPHLSKLEEDNSRSTVLSSSGDRKYIFKLSEYLDKIEDLKERLKTNDSETVLLTPDQTIALLSIAIRDAIATGHSFYVDNLTLNQTEIDGKIVLKAKGRFMDARYASVLEFELHNSGDTLVTKNLKFDSKDESLKQKVEGSIANDDKAIGVNIYQQIQKAAKVELSLLASQSIMTKDGLELSLKKLITTEEIEQKYKDGTLDLAELAKQFDFTNYRTLSVNKTHLTEKPQRDLERLEKIREIFNRRFGFFDPGESSSQKDEYGLLTQLFMTDTPNELQQENQKDLINLAIEQLARDEGVDRTRILRVYNSISFDVALSTPITSERFISFFQNTKPWAKEGPNDRKEEKRSDRMKVLMSGLSYKELTSLWDNKENRRNIDLHLLAGQYNRSEHLELDKSQPELSNDGVELRNRYSIILDIFKETVARYGQNSFMSRFGSPPEEEGRLKDLWEEKRQELALFMIRFYSGKEDKDNLNKELGNWIINTNSQLNSN